MLPSKIPKIQSFSVVLAVALILNMFFWHSTLIGVLGGTAFLLLVSLCLGTHMVRHPHWGWRLFLGVIMTVCLIIISGTAAFYTYQLNTLLVSLLVISLTLLTALTLPTFQPVRPHIHLTWPKPQISTLLIGCWLTIEFVCFFLVTKAQTGNAIRSPWQVIPPEFFAWYFFSTAFLIVIALFHKNRLTAFTLIIVHAGLSASIAMLVYHLGYGFDPFIHRATERLISQTGSISPKPLYYVGQYALIVILSKLFYLPTDTLDLFLVPLFFSVVLPAVVYFSFSQIIGKKNAVPLMALMLLTFPFSTFIVTTPQSLANALILIAILLSTNIVFGKNPFWLIPLACLILSAVCIHPLTGIPGVIFYVILLIYALMREGSTVVRVLQRILIAEWGLFACFAIPLVFLINSEVSKSLTSTVSFDFLKNPLLLLQALDFAWPKIFNNFHLVLDLVYWYSANVFCLLLLLTLVGAYILIRRHRIGSAWIYLVTFGILLANYFFLKTMIHFPTLIDYEQANYPNRLLEIAFYFLSPLVLYAWTYILTWTQKRYRLALAFFILLGAFFISSSLYISYPRADEYHLDRGYNLTQSDINAVHFIDENAKGDYIVLANQMTSVAAIKEFGFKKYYSDLSDPKKQYFYYPIPTGDPLYQYYLDMVYGRPTKKNALAAGERLGVMSVYFVLDEYWDDFDRLVEEAKQEADTYINIDQGKAYVFHYQAK